MQDHLAAVELPHGGAFGEPLPLGIADPSEQIDPSQVPDFVQPVPGTHQPGQRRRVERPFPCGGIAHHCRAAA
jgi:hypothetical protein